MISRNNGWLTVDPNTMSRKNAYEKKVKGDIHKTSSMSPQWMQTDAKPDKLKIRLFKGVSAKNKNIRCESNRVIVAETK